MNEYKDLLLPLDWCYEEQDHCNTLAVKKAIKREWRLRIRESTSLQSDLTELEAPIPNLQAVEMWQHANHELVKMQEALNRLRIENNIMAIRRVRYGMIQVGKTFLQANGHRMSQAEEENILCADEYLSNPDEE